ncbi:MAG: ribonucleotide-diphosphate reductase subunit alpha, partial [Thermoplasmata archaeon]
VEEDKEWNLVFNGKVYKTVPARKIWGRIVEGAWNNGEPGIVFLDTVNRHNPLSHLGEIESTNPCGEQPLLPYGSCNLGSINLANMVKGDWVAGNGEIDYGRIKETVKMAVRFLDSVITVNHYPIPEVKRTALLTRQIGLGVMGFADVCIKMHVRYGSDRCIHLAKTVMQMIYESAVEVSMELGKEKGIPQGVHKGYRNGALTSIAPTGTLSIIADCSSGIEPHFAFRYTKACIDDELSMMPAVVREYVTKKGIESLKDLPEFFVTTMDVTLEEHIRVQAAFQQSGVDSGVSKTINAPNSTTMDQVSDAFFLAWKEGCKGVTFYRDGSREVQAVYNGEKEKENRDELLRGELKERPRGTFGPSFKMQTACGRLYADPHFDSDGATEIFVRTVGGGCEANAKALGVLCSMILRAGVSPKTLIRKLKGIHCPACTKAISAGKNVEVVSCAAGIGKSLEIALENGDEFARIARQVGELDQKFGKKPKKKARRCPDCGATIYQADGCVICSNPECGWSKC